MQPNTTVFLVARMAQSGGCIKPVLDIATFTVIGQLGQIGCFVLWVKIGVDKFQIGGTEAGARERQRSNVVGMVSEGIR